MRFVETAIFTKSLHETLSDEKYRSVQLSLLLRPSHGPVIRGSGGLRKVRCRVQGRGKRGGVRIIYYWDEANDVIYLLFIYKKVEQDDLTPQQLKILRKLVREEFK